MEGDFNFFNKWFFGHEVVNRLYKIGYVPEDQYSTKSSTAEDSKLDNRLTMDLPRQLRLPLVAILADADKCYDRINHIVMSLLLLVLMGEQDPIQSMLQPIQQMKFYQQTGQGDSTTYMGGQSKVDPLQGLCQGKRAAPECWIMVSSLMMLVYRKQGHISTLVSPISGAKIEFMGEIYVDDTNLLTILAEEYDKNKVIQQAQVNLTKWAHLLNVTGGALNPSKCYWYMIAHKYHEGQWVYNNEPPLGNLKIPLPDGTKAESAYLPVTEVRKMLGVWSSPDGNDTTHLQEVVVKKAEKWVQRLKNAHLLTHLVWKAYLKKSSIGGNQYLEYLWELGELLVYTYWWCWHLCPSWLTMVCPW